MISRLAIASVIDNAAPTNDKAASFFSDPVRLPNSPSIPCTTAGTNAIPRNSFDKKFTIIPP
jgi:hypothetical protein